MATVQHSVEVNVPAHTAYHRLTRFEEYPRFMEDVESVRQVDDMHLHWAARKETGAVEWDAEIDQQEPDRCIAWHSTNGPTNNGKLEVRDLGGNSSQVTFTLQAEPEETPGSKPGDTTEEMEQRLQRDLARLKDFMEAGGSETGTSSQPVGTSAVVGATGGTDAAAGAKLSGSKGGPGGPSPRKTVDSTGVPGTPGGMVQGESISPGAGAEAAGGTGLGSAATADDTRTGTGTASGLGTGLTGGGMSGARDAGISKNK